MKQELNSLRERDQLRILRESRFDAGLLNLSSNDYLGLSSIPELRDEFYTGLQYNATDAAYALSSSSSRLLTGNHSGYSGLETVLKKLYERPALVFNSGYHANIGILPALTTGSDLILCDRLNHASIIDGVRLSDAHFKRYPHLDYEILEGLLIKSAAEYKNVFIITESVFSMDGDMADLRRLVELKERYNATLIVDEAHSVGVFGDNGRGLAEAQGVLGKVDILVGTFGKAFCSAGAFAVMDEITRDYLINKMRPFIFTTALPPVTVNWSRFVLEKNALLKERREHLLKISSRLRSELGLESDSQIVPLLLGENSAALEMAEKFRKAGILVFAIRPPAVPAGTARIRLSLNASLQNKDIDKILDCLLT
ncbi:MAG: 8-amino-7-oxononanoate synthase [Victivallaceae bacterium]|nr:8-amino-7-oxononanoate synthase [Victivallaceae bacterium]